MMRALADSDGGKSLIASAKARGSYAYFQRLTSRDRQGGGARVGDVMPGTAIGLVLLANAILLRLIFRADIAQVWVFGRRIAWTCGMRQTFGIPCPTCGLTRSVVLSLHGELSSAWSIAPAGVLIAFGLLGFGAALVAMAGIHVIGARRMYVVSRIWLYRTAWIYCSLFMIVWLGGWTASLFNPH